MVEFRVTFSAGSIHAARADHPGSGPKLTSSQEENPREIRIAGITIALSATLKKKAAC
jgi:hypothetical protein